MEAPTSGNRQNKMRMRTMGMAAGVIAALLAAAIVFALPSASAQGSNSTKSNSGNSADTSTTIPDIKGSVSVENATNAFVRDNVKVPFATALSTVQDQAEDNERVLGGRLGVVQSYLVYTFKVANYDAETYKLVIVDAGNGSVLYTSEDMTLYNGGIGCGWGRNHGFSGMKWGMGEKASSSSSNTSSSSILATSV